MNASPPRSAPGFAGRLGFARFSEPYVRGRVLGSGPGSAPMLRRNSAHWFGFGAVFDYRAVVVAAKLHGYSSSALGAMDAHVKGGTAPRRLSAPERYAAVSRFAPKHSYRSLPPLLVQASPAQRVRRCGTRAFGATWVKFACPDRTLRSISRRSSHGRRMHAVVPGYRRRTGSAV
jgi:hypothetical protein